MARSRVLALLVLVITIIIVVYPEAAFRASLDGLKLWFEIVLPALLPFFIMADLLMGLGVVHFIGALLEPLMRPLFKIPGVGGFAVAMGLAAGYPLGAKITGELKRKNLLTPVEAERLVSFANTADPLFIIGAVAVGMFNFPELGATLVLAHYLAAVLVGFCMRFHRGQESPVIKRKAGYFQNAFRSLDAARRKDGRSLGRLFGDSVQDTFQAMLFIGGCIMIFSVLVRVINAAGFMAPINVIIAQILAFLGLDKNLGPAVVNGFFETTLGAQTASLALAPLQAQATITSFVVGWSGLSVLSQVAALLAGTKIRLGPYLLARLLHGFFAAVITAVLLGPADFIPAALIKAVPALSGVDLIKGSFLGRLLASTRLAASITFILVIFLSLVWLVKRIVYISFRSS
ncbi:MAG TPA: sporulation integral membrane protein YlbJ [Firmicutes bacterium]|nr:sporulation integral membrane protein YlbJ [Bacillota bacterium]